MILQFLNSTSRILTVAPASETENKSEVPLKRATPVSGVGESDNVLRDPGASNEKRRVETRAQGFLRWMKDFHPIRGLLA